MNELFKTILFLPEQASTIAPSLDHLHYWVIGTTMVVSTACGMSALYFFVRFRRRHDHERTTPVAPPRWFEPLVVVVPLATFLTWWVIGFRGYIRITTPPPGAMDVYVTGKQWMWKFSYPGGPNSIDTLHVPAHRPVRVLMTSRDVIHSFFVPSFRIKQDVVPGRYSQTWFEAVAPGTYQILCAEMCGPGHSVMRGDVVAHEPAEFEAWLAEQRRGRQEQRDVGESARVPEAADLVQQGERVAAEAGCFKCHSIDGTPHIGPTFLDLYLRPERMQDGAVVVADEGYLTESMMDPLARIVAGYLPVMPTYQGRLSPPEAAALLEYIRSLRTVGRPPSEPVGATYRPAPPAREAVSP